MTVALISHHDCELHDMGAGHPEQPRRLSAIHDALVSRGLDLILRHYDAPAVTRAQLARVHSVDYIDRIAAASPANGWTMLDGDTLMCPHSYTAALHAAGALVRAVDLILDGEVDAAFCNVRPPGHHAERARAMGFCLFNNVAVGVAHALAAHGLERVAIVDFDVHHGNGTEDIVAGDPRVLFCSAFQHPFYPYSGADSTAPNVRNVPLPAGTKGEAWRAAVAAAWLEALEAFRPQMVFFSAGFDAHAADPLAGMLLTEPDYTWITSAVKAIADRHCRGRMVSTLEGGYDLPALGRSVAAHIDAMVGFK